MGIFMKTLSEITAIPIEVRLLQAMSDDRGPNFLDAGRGVGGQAIEGFMSQYGYKRIGPRSTGYASVYRKGNENQVIKIFANDAPTVEWVRYSVKHQHNPYVPKIYGSLIHIRNDFYAVRMEYLSEHYTEFDAVNIPTCIQLLADNYPEFVHGLKGIVSKYLYDYFNTYMPDYYKDFQLMEVCKWLHYNHNEHIDIKRNVFYRGDQPVLADPVAP